MTGDPLNIDRLPIPGAGFVWNRLPVVGDDAWFLRPDTDRAVAGYTTRRGGVSNGPLGKLNVSLLMEQRYGDNPMRTFANRDLASRCVGRGVRDWPGTKQAHSATVVEASRSRVEADGFWTDDPARMLAVTSADCVLLLLVGDERIAVAHAGWRGMVAGVVENAVRAISADTVYAGPAIGPCCFEVGPEVIEEFHGAAIADERHVDLWVAAETAARRAGAGTFHAARLCTSCEAGLFYSHRRDHGETGRQALIARLPS